jgi:hypothetical protein
MLISCKTTTASYSIVTKFYVAAALSITQNFFILRKALEGIRKTDTEKRESQA